MLDHELFLFGGEPIALLLAQHDCGRGDRGFFFCTLRGDMVDRADVLRRCSIAPGTPMTFACFLHIHHPTCIRELWPRIVEER